MSHQLTPQMASPLEPRSMQDEESFIVIARSSPNNSNVSQINGPTSAIDTITLQEPPTVSLASSVMLSGLSPDEIQSRVQALLEENGELKEALRQNNLAMKKQFSTLVMWQEEVYKVHQNHKQKFEETKELVLKLKGENAELRKVVADLESSQESSPDLAKLQAENAFLRRKVSEAEAKEKVVCLKEFQLKKEIADYKGKVEELQKRLIQYQDGSTLLEGSPSKQHRKAIAAVTAEKEELGGSGNLNHLGLTLPSEKEKPNSLGNSFVLVGENLKKSQKSAEEMAIRRQLEESQKVLEVERQALEEDRKALDKSRRAMAEKLRETEMLKQKAELERENMTMRMAEITDQLNQERESGKELLKALEDRLNDSVPHDYGNWELVNTATNGRGVPISACESRLGLIRKYLHTEEIKNIKIEVLVQKLQHIVMSLMAVDPSIGKELREEVLNLKKQIDVDVDEVKQQRVYIQEAENLLADLKMGYDTIIAKEASISSAIKENADADYHKAQADGYRQKLDDVTARLAHAEEALRNSCSETVSLTEKLRKAGEALEEIPILKAQVEVYQTDFNTERDERSRMASDKQRLEEEVHRLRVQNQQLIDDIENMERRNVREQRSPPDGMPPASAPPSSRMASPRVNASNTLAAPGRGGHRNEVPEQYEAPQDRSARGSSEPKIFTCPKCFRAYMELGPLEIHVNQCLDTP